MGWPPFYLIRLYHPSPLCPSLFFILGCEYDKLLFLLSQVVSLFFHYYYYLCIVRKEKRKKKEARGFTVATPPSAKIHSHPIYTHTPFFLSDPDGSSQLNIKIKIKIQYPMA